MVAQLVPSLTKALLDQFQAFGLMGAYLNIALPSGKLTDAQGQDLTHLSQLDLDALKHADLSALETPKAVTDNLSWCWERRLDLSDLDRFESTRLPGCQPLFYLADQSDANRLDPDLPLLYQTANWPAGTPPAGRVSDAPAFTWQDMRTSYSAMWRLQLNRPHGVSIATYTTAQKLIRAALWIVRENGFLPALDYLFALMDRGFLIDSDAAVIAFARLFFARRQVSDDAELPKYLLHDANLDMAGWKDTQLKITLPATPKRVLGDDAEFVLFAVEERSLLARNSSDLDGWLLAYSRLGLAARVTHLSLRVVKLDKELAFASHTARFEEIHCDVMPFFDAFAKGAARHDYGTFLQPDWTMAIAFGLMAKNHSPEWLPHMLEERVVLPEALKPAFLAKPLGFEQPPQWRRPSAKLAPILGALCFRGTPHERHRARQGDATTRNIVATTLRTLKIEDSDKEIRDLASAIWPLFYREATLGPPPHDSDAEILQNFLLYLVQGMPAEKADAAAWLDGLHLELSEHELQRANLPIETPGALADHDSRLARAERIVADYPFSSQAREQLSLRLYESGRNAEARKVVEEALLLDPSNRRSWLAAALICIALGEEEDEQVAAGVAKYLELAHVGMAAGPS
jgi:hypothetical protein